MAHSNSRKRRCSTSSGSALLLDGKCSICLVIPTAGEEGLLLAAPCDHVFYSQCIKAALACSCETPAARGGRNQCQCRGLCPTCRAATGSADLKALWSSGLTLPSLEDPASRNADRGPLVKTTGQRRRCGISHNKPSSQRREPKHHITEVCSCDEWQQ